MPNWSFNHHAIKGHKADVLKLLNDAIENSVKFRNEFGEPINNIKPQTNVQKAFDELMRIGCSLYDNHNFGEPKKDEPVVENNITLGTFRPMPVIFLYYDTESYGDKFPEIVKEMQEKYGVRSWYEYGNTYNSTKWNSKLENFSIYVEGDVVTIYFDSDTAWSSPDGWCKWLKEQYPNLAVFICANDESGAFYFYQEMGEEPHNWADEIQGRLNEFDSEHTDDDYEERWEVENDAIEEMVSEFNDYVEDYEI